MWPLWSRDCHGRRMADRENVRRHFFLQHMTDIHYRDTQWSKEHSYENHPRCCVFWIASDNPVILWREKLIGLCYLRRMPSVDNMQHWPASWTLTGRRSDSVRKSLDCALAVCCPWNKHYNWIMTQCRWHEQGKRDFIPKPGEGLM